MRVRRPCSSCGVVSLFTNHAIVNVKRPRMTGGSADRGAGTEYIIRYWFGHGLCHLLTIYSATDVTTVLSEVRDIELSLFATSITLQCPSGHKLH